MSDDLKIPILVQHDATRAPIGVTAIKNGRLHVRMRPEHALTRAALFNIFGGAGVSVLEMISVEGSEEPRIVEFAIHEFSLDQPALLIPKDAKLPDGPLPPGRIEFVQGDEKDVLFALIQEYRAAYAEAQDVRFFDYKRFEKADRIKKQLWQAIEKGIK